MRYSLRNQQKLTAKFGKVFTLNLLNSLTSFFKSNTDIQEFNVQGYKYAFILVPSLGNSNVHIRFAITGKTYDVYNLAYFDTQSCNTEK